MNVRSSEALREAIREALSCCRSSRGDREEESENPIVVQRGLFMPLARRFFRMRTSGYISDQIP